MPTAVTEGSLLDGRVRHDQFADGHRTGIEPVLLAASVPGRSGERVLEGGTGTGAALLCLAARIGICGIGIECDPRTAELARRNIAANGFAGLEVMTADIATAQPTGRFDHAFANPPWHDPAGTASADPQRRRARLAAPGLFALWAVRLAAPLRAAGTLTLIVAARALPESLAALHEAGCGSPAVLPLWPRPDRAAKLCLVRGTKSGRGPCRILPGLTLHTQSGAYTERATAILRHGEALCWTGEE